MATTLDTVRRDAIPVARAGYPAGGLRFDSAVVALSGWLIGGIFLDGWAHNHHPDLETFFTPWHAALYSGFFALFAFLVLAAARNRGRGYAWRCVLPVGYDLSLIGGFIFLVGGVLDLVWHQVFGIEADTEALLSPTHLILALGVTLMVSGPLRAAWRRPRIATEGARGGAAAWAALLPVLLALTFLLSLFTFFTQFAHPQVNTWATLDAAKQQVRSEVFAMGRD